MEYPYFSPVILTDDIFNAYGGDLTHASSQQLQAAYLLGEMFVSEDLKTFLMPTMITGTYNPASRVMLDHTYVRAVHKVEFIDRDEDIYYTIEGTNNIYVSIQDDTRGIVDINWIITQCNCHLAYPYKLRIVYETGLATGTVTQPSMLLALTGAATIVLNEILGYGNESTGDVGIESFKNQSYFEKRVPMLRTAYGTSAKAQFIHKLLSSLRLKKWVGM